MRLVGEAWYGYNPIAIWGPILTIFTAFLILLIAYIYVKKKSSSIFNYALLIATSLEFIVLPILNQYLSGGFQASLYLVLYSIIINLFGFSDKMNGYSVHDFLDLFESGTDNDSEEGEK